MAMELDEALVFLGDFGRYQTLIYLLICLAGQVPSAWHMLGISFLGAVPGHHCKVPAGEQLEETVPKVTGDNGEEYSKCFKYVNITVDNETMPCDEGWNYDQTYYGNTVATEWDLVCEKDASVDLSQTIFMLGVMVGSLLFGQLSDRFGRRYVFFLSLWAQVAFGVGAAFTGNLYAFIAVRFFVGVIEQGVDITSYVMVTEMFSPSRRAFAGILLTLFWASGIMSLSGIAYLLRDWRHLQLAITLPSLLTIPLWWIIPESARWLISRGRVHEAETILQKIARFNKVDLPDGVLTEDSRPHRFSLSGFEGRNFYFCHGSIVLKLCRPWCMLLWGIQRNTRVQKSVAFWNLRISMSLNRLTAASTNAKSLKICDNAILYTFICDVLILMFWLFTKCQSVISLSKSTCKTQVLLREKISVHITRTWQVSPFRHILDKGPPSSNDPSPSSHVQAPTLDSKSPAGLQTAYVSDTEVEMRDEGATATLPTQPVGDYGVSEKKGRVYTIWHLFRTPQIRRISLVMIFTWFVNSLVYYGLSLNTDSLAGNPYLNFFLSGAVEIPAYIVSTAVVTWFGRRIPLCVFHVAGGIACIVTAFIPQTTESGVDLSALIISTAMLGKFGIAGSYAIVFLYATELFPTVTRNLGVGMSSFSSRVGGILAPIIMYLEKFAAWAPMVIFGGLSVIAGLCVLVLHETLGKKQPQTIDEVEGTQ
ncbi:organic cation transporter protein-like isoform X1 [Acanthaster planci]|uniref:Organic cation transporter protein-like isoform X1 n=1 Tax=Acanthaster planci TaxID=133434 RepID=A0A8B7ZYR8_ACAPL|nr:organic cation transporter protein-like isoform X1 [Acanthaster planci]